MMKKTKNEIKTIIEESSKVIVLFSVTWCGECIMTKPIYEKVAQMEEFNDFSFYTVNVDDAELWEDDGDETFAIKEVPSLIIYKDNKEVSRTTNFISEEKMKQLILEQK